MQTIDLEFERQERKIKVNFMGNYRIWLIEIKMKKDDRWIPMYQPCYSQAEAETKAKLKAKWAGEESVRVQAYIRDN